MHGRPTPPGETACARKRSATHATTCYARGDELAALDGRTPVCRSEVPHLWASPLFVARAQGSANRDQLSGAGVQLETHGECHGRTGDPNEAGNGLRNPVLSRAQHRFLGATTESFVTDSPARG